MKSGASALAVGAKPHVAEVGQVGSPHVPANKRLRHLPGVERKPSLSGDVVQSSKRQTQRTPVTPAVVAPFQMAADRDALATFDTAREVAGSPADISSQGEVQQLAQAINQCAQDIRAVARDAMLSHSQLPVGEFVKVSIVAITKYVRAQAEALDKSAYDSAQLKEIQCICSAAKEGALRAFQNTFDEQTIQGIRRKVIDAVENGGQSPAQAATVVIFESMKPVFEHPDIDEIVNVSVAAVAATAVSAMKQACELSSSSQKEISQFVKDKLNEVLAGQMVVDFLTGVVSAQAASQPPQASRVTG